MYLIESPIDGMPARTKSKKVYIIADAPDARNFLRAHVGTYYQGACLVEGSVWIDAPKTLIARIKFKISKDWAETSETLNLITTKKPESQPQHAPDKKAASPRKRAPGQAV